MDEQELKQELVTLDDRVRALTVNTAGEYQLAGQMVIAIDGVVKKINAYWKEPIEKAFQAHKSLTAKRKEMLDPVEFLRKSANAKISAYLTAQEHIRRAEQARLDKERLDREAAERAKLEKRAEKAEEKGNADKAAELRDKAADVYVPPVIAAPAVEKTTRMDTGTVSTRKDIEITITDPMAVVKAVASGQLGIGIITISEPKLKADIKLRNIRTLEGVQIREVVNASFRGK